jgi:alkyl hydroperoxide reductase subunit AhpC
VIGVSRVDFVAIPSTNVERARGFYVELQDKGVEFMGDTLDTGVCHMAFLADPDGDILMLHNRYAPYDDEAGP